MADSRLDISQNGDVTIARFLDKKILDQSSIQELGNELFALVEEAKKEKLLLDFSDVEFLSSAALNKLIVLDRKMKASGGKLKFANLRPETHEVFMITRLNQLFDIQKDEAEALASF